MPDNDAATRAPGTPSAEGVTIAAGDPPSLGLFLGEDQNALPTTIGRYRILRLLGEGGMGAVYEAEQDQPRRGVALKVIKSAWANRELVRRFEQESQALGRLHHPGIAQIYEAGSAETSFGVQPFFAMELIRGRPLVEYANAEKLTTRQRLELMIQVCDAVQHAHRRGIIHRDLKPGNILVDESGQPKILDFGLARATDSDAQATRQTDLGQLLGTLAYMSPEQVLADPLALDTRSDVYALGVILYELLAGKLPYSLPRTMLEAVRTIQQTDPAPLSSVHRDYRGDIETIVAKALEKDKTRRYASAAELAADIRRHLRDEPIVARPPGTAYQLAKFARRNKALVTGVAAVFLVLVLGIAASSREAIQARKAEARAIEAQKKAQQESETSRAVSDFLRNDLLAQASPYGQSGPNTKPDPDMKVRTALDRAASRIDGKFGKQPDLESAIRETLAETYTDLGLFPQARSQFERALDLRRRVSGAENPTTIETLNKFAQMDQADGKYTEAETMASQAYQTSRRVLGLDNADTFRAMQMLGWIYYKEGKYGQAETLDKQALEVSRRVFSGDNADTVHLLGNMTATLAAEDKIKDAESLDRQRLEMSRRVEGAEGPDTLAAMNDLAEDYGDEEKLPQAEDLLAQVVAIRRRAMGAEHPDTLVSMANLASFYNNDGKAAQAAPIFEEVVKISTRVLGLENMDTLNAMENLGMAYSLEGQHQSGEALIGRACEYKRRVYGAEGPGTLRCLYHLVMAYVRAGAFRSAEKPGAELVAEETHASGASSPSTTEARIELALIYASEGKYALAEPMVRQALEAVKNAPADNWVRLTAESVMGTTLVGEKRYAEAEPMMLHAYRGMLAGEGRVDAPDRDCVDFTRKWLVKLYEDWGRPDQAAEWKNK